MKITVESLVFEIFREGKNDVLYVLDRDLIGIKLKSCGIYLSIFFFSSFDIGTINGAFKFSIKRINEFS